MIRQCVLKISVFLISLNFICTGCSNISSHSNDRKPKVLAINAIIHNSIKNIVGDLIDVDLLIDNNLDPHSYEISKGDDDKFLGNHVIFCNGLGLEHTLSLRKLLEYQDNVVSLGDRVIAKNKKLFLEEDGFPDPHIWMDLQIWLQVVREISNVLIQIFPDYALEFKKNTQKFEKQILDLDLWAVQILKSIPENRRYLVTCHSAFNYFVRRYLAEPNEIANRSWLKRSRAPEGISPEVQISIRDIMDVVSYVKKNDVEVIFIENSLNQDSVRKIMKCVNTDKDALKVRLSSDVLYSDSLKGDYMSTFEHNVKLIEKELKRGTVG